MLESTIGVHLGVAECGIESAADPLSGSERESLGIASPQRVHEFALGRTCARRSLLILGVTGGELLRCADGSVAWPSGTTGSISHSATWVAAVAGLLGDYDSIGVDVEDIRSISMEALQLVASTSELANIGRLGEDAHSVARYATSLFSAKEAAFKALKPFVGPALDMHDFAVEFHESAKSFVTVAHRGSPVSKALSEREFNGTIISDAERVAVVVASGAVAQHSFRC